jgi:prepilin-type N-terminal cleavage/methylation domain-containing protein/prepilin-type processing-associated H-X9-DG protein
MCKAETDFFSSPPTRRAFTLIEMLVVIAIIALLVSLIVPSITNAISSAKHAKSMSNLRQWGTAMHLYMAENQGDMPSRGPSQQPPWGMIAATHVESVRTAWYNTLPPYVGELSLGKIPADERAGFLTGDSMHRDPTAKFRVSDLSRRPLFSYSFNSQINTSREHGDDVPGLGDVRSEVLSFSMYNSPANTVAFFETRAGPDDGHPSQKKNSQYARAYGHSRHLSFRYGGKVNLLFLDGSVRRFKSEDLFNGTQVVNDEVYWAGLE